MPKKVGDTETPPTGEYIHLRVHGKEMFQPGTFRIVPFGKGIKARMGRLKGKGKMGIVSLLFDKEKWTPEKARKWFKDHQESMKAEELEKLVASAETDEWEDVAFASTIIEVDPVSVGLELPEATTTKVYAVSKLCSFFPEVINANHDAFDEGDIGETWQTLIGSPVMANPQMQSHKNMSQIGSVVDASKVEGDGIYVLHAIQRDPLDDLGVDPEDLTKGYSVSLEAIFRKPKARYKKGGAIYSHSEAVDAGIASPVGEPDNPAHYDARLIPVEEFNAVAFLRRGRNADPTADFMAVAAEDTMDEKVTSGATDTEKQAQKRRAAKYGIAIRDDGNVTKPSKWDSVPDSLWGDPVNYLYPMPDKAHARNALARFSQNSGGYGSGDAGKVKARIERRAKALGIKIADQAAAAHLAGDYSIDEVRGILQQALIESDVFLGAMYVDVVDVRISGGDLTQGYVIAYNGGKYFQVPYTMDANDEVTFGDAVEGRFVTSFQPIEQEPNNVKIGGSSMADEKPTEAEILEKFKASDEFKALMVKAAADAVVEYKEREDTFAARMKSLTEILPVSDEEKGDLEAKVRAADETAFLKLENEHLKKARAAKPEPKTEKAKAALGGPGDTDDKPKSRSPYLPPE